MEELAKIVESNAKAIAALTSDIQEMKTQSKALPVSLCETMAHSRRTVM